ncbi:MAG: nickel pincer cofactor biosynthesis protein LarB [Acidimicrobiia bacterium]
MSDSTHVVANGDTRLDVGRAGRIGIPEAVYAQGKTVGQCVEIVEALLDRSEHPIIVTRADPHQVTALASLKPTLSLSGTLTWNHAQPRDVSPVAILSGGTSDRPVVDECRATLEAMGVPVEVRGDVGVAGIHRLMDVLPTIEEHSVVVAVAGMEASLPTVLGGLISAPLIGVPTSAGYGSSFEGITALLSMLSSCAPGISVVGIDNGYGAACAAMRIINS